tara:strand:- start:840 stop:1037 length:198 start_codon:yes stop_codon:yes gene_type:complete
VAAVAAASRLTRMRICAAAECVGCGCGCWRCWVRAWAAHLNEELDGDVLLSHPLYCLHAQPGELR